MGKKKKKNRRRRERQGDSTARVRLSLCVIARDEAAFLDRCLRSAQGLADEIVVVDTGSADATPQVARQHGARVYNHTWTEDFSAARNQSLEAARGEWILVLDCDEVIARRDHGEIRQAMDREGMDAFRLTTRNYTEAANRAGWVACTGDYAEEKGYPGWFPTTKVRLWRNRRKTRFAGAVHELVEPSIMEAGGRIGDCMAPVHHYGYVEKTRSKEAYVEAGERKVRDNPDDLRARYELAIAYRNAGRLQEARQSSEAVIAGLGEADAAARIYLQEEFVLLVHADILTRLGLLEEALAAYDRILERFPCSFQAFNNKGTILERQERLEEARHCYAQGAAMAPDNRILTENLARLSPPADTGWRLSVCIIARDEEAVLGRCLESVQEVADEIVVVDTGSMDRTVEIAGRYGARVSPFAWGDDFAAARNESLKRATGDWILWLDADDYLLPADQEKVRQVKRRKPDQAFYFTLVNEGAERSRFWQVKMFPNHPEIRFERPVHETVMPALQRLGLAVGDAGVEVHHTGYAEPETGQRKRRYYLRLMEDWVADHPEDYAIRFRIGHTHYIDGERERARACFAQVLEAGVGAVDSQTACRAAAFTGRCLLEEGAYEQAVPYLEQARRLRPDDALVLLSLGDACTKTSQYAKGVEFLQAALAGQVDPTFPLDARFIEYSARFFLGQAYQGLGRIAAATAAFRAARDLLPERPEASQALEQLSGARTAGAGLYLAPETVASAAEELHRAQRISLCMIVRDEEQRLGDCLDSVQGLVDEIVVVDTGSTDRTVEIADRYGARMGRFPWCDDFAAARNESFKLATGDWILWLDADDLLPAEEHAKIRHLVGRGKDKSYFFVLEDRGYEHVSCLQMRLFPNLPGVEFEMPVHEQVTPSLTRLGVEMVPTDIRVVHTGYVTPEVVRAKKERYLGIMERWLEEHPDNYIVRSHVALTYHTTGRLDEAVDAYRQIVFASACLEDRNYVVYTTALLFLGRTYLKKGDLDQARQYMLQAEEIDPDYILTKLSLAEVHARRGEFAAALQYTRAVLEGGRQLTFFPIDYPEVVYSARVLCGKAHQGLGEWAAAEQAFRQAAESPVARRSEALGSLSELFKSRGNFQRALQVLDEARQLDPENVQHLFNAGALYLEKREWESAAEFFEQVVERVPDSAPALLNLGYIAKMKGAFDEAEQIYRQAIEHDAQGVEARANLAHLLLDLERFDEAKAVFAEVRQRRTGLLDIDLGLLVTLCQQGEWEPVKGLMGEILALFPAVERQFGDPSGGARTLVRLGAALVGDKLTKCAEFAFMGAVFLDGDFAEARRGLAELHFVQGAYWKSVGQYEIMLAANPRDSAAFRRLGDCYQRLGVGEAARMCYAQSRKVGGG